MAIVNGNRYGARVRMLRRNHKLTQVELARRLEISPSYLNLIEHDQRALTAPLLVKLAQQFELDLSEFGAGGSERLANDLNEVFSDPALGEEGPPNEEVNEVVTNAPQVGRSIVALYRAYREAKQAADTLASQIYEGHQALGDASSPIASEQINDYFQRHNNYFDELERQAERLRRRLNLPVEDHEQVSITRDQVLACLCRTLENDHGIRIELASRSRIDALRVFDRSSKRMVLSEVMNQASRAFQTATQLALVEHGEIIDDLISKGGLTTPVARSLGRVVLANYFAGAVLMPYEGVLSAARAERFDLEILTQRFGVTYEQICHRLTSLQRPGYEGIPFHMIRVDLAGNISKRFSGSGIRFARFSGACPRWNVFSAFLAPGTLRIQLSQMPDGEVYFCVARTVPKGRGGYHAPHTIQAIGLGCHIDYANEMIYADGVDLNDTSSAVPIGVTCRLCPRKHCEQRAFPSIRDPWVIDEDRRGPSIYALPDTSV